MDAKSDKPDGGSSEYRIFILDKNSGLKFQVDTGAEVCVFPRSLTEGSLEKDRLFLRVVNGEEMITYGSVLLDVDFGMKKPYKWEFVIADSEHPIIGMDFLYNFNLMVDAKKKRIIDSAYVVVVDNGAASDKNEDDFELLPPAFKETLV